MEQQLINPEEPFQKVSLKHISEATTEMVSFMERRKSGVDKPLKTKWTKLNYRLGGGIEPGTIVTIAGMSGSGKSAFANMLETDLIDINESEDIIVLSFSFEMQGSKQVGRKVSNKAKRKVSDIYSGNKKLSDEEMSHLKTVSESFKKYPIYYVEDNDLTVKDIKNTIDSFRTVYCKDKWLIVFIDHTLLIGGEIGEGDRKVISDLEKMLLAQKKKGKTTLIQLSQLNRDIEDNERKRNPSMHYPQRSDLSSSDTMYHASDVVMVIHRPEILGITGYGPSQMKTKDMIYVHFIKNRDGELSIIRFENDLEHNNFIEYVDENKAQEPELKF